MNKLIRFIFPFIFFVLLFESLTPANCKEEFTVMVKNEKKELIKITNVELKQDKNSSKIILQLSRPINNVPAVMASLETVTFDIDAVYGKKRQEARGKKQEEQENKLQVQNYEITSDNFVNKVTWYTNLAGTSFEIKRKYYTPVNLIKQDRPSALIVELPRNYFNKESWELKPGITRHLIRLENERGPVTANILEIDLSNQNISIKTGLPDKKKIKAKETLTNIVKNEMAFAGINANYFDVKLGNPLGTLITEGTWLIGPVYDRVAIGFSEDKKALINQVMLVGNATVFRGFRKKLFAMFDIDGLNIPYPLYKKVGLYTNNWDEEIVLPEDTIGVLVQGSCIKKITSKLIKIPDNGYVLVSNENYVLSTLKRKKDCIEIEWQSDPDWSSIQEAVSGGPYLIMGGQVYIDELRQNFKFTKKDTYAPRTAIGIGKNERLYLITVDGRRSGYSVGLTLKELAELSKKLDLKEAINLDGGGSTELVIDGEIINKLSEHHERKISNALLIFYNEQR